LLPHFVVKSRTQCMYGGHEESSFKHAKSVFSEGPKFENFKYN